MRIQSVISAALSVAVSACLFGPGSFHDFAFYVICVFNVLAWLVVMTVGVKPDTAEAIRSGLPLSLVSSAIQLYALIVTGHPVLAASSLILSILIVGASYRKPEAA